MMGISRSRRRLCRTLAAAVATVALAWPQAVSAAPADTRSSALAADFARDYLDSVDRLPWGELLKLRALCARGFGDEFLAIGRDMGHGEVDVVDLCLTVIGADARWLRSDGYFDHRARLSGMNETGFVFRARLSRHARAERAYVVLPNGAVYVIRSEEAADAGFRAGLAGWASARHVTLSEGSARVQLARCYAGAGIVSIRGCWEAGAALGSASEKR